MRRRVFLDTAFIQALFNGADQHHHRARVWGPFVRKAELWTTEAVLTEIGNAFSESSRQMAIDTIRQMYLTPTTHVISVIPSLFQRALQLYEDRSDKEWGLTDCISFVVMTEQGLSEALTADRHFEQAGFTALLRHDPS